MNVERLSKVFPLILISALLASAFVVGAYLQRGTDIVRTSGYPLDDTPALAASYPGNRLVIVGTVEGHLPARRSAPEEKAESGIGFVYTPVRVAVEQIVSGTATPADPVLVRGLGGVVDGTRHIVEDVPSISELPAGQRVLLFLGDARDTGDGLVARTPHLIYWIDAADVVSSPDGDVSIPLAVFIGLIQANN